MKVNLFNLEMTKANHLPHPSDEFEKLQAIIELDAIELTLVGGATRRPSDVPV